MKNILKMTTVLLIMLISVFIIAHIARAATGDITKAEVRADVASYKLDTVIFRIITRTCEVTYRKVDSSGDPVGEEISVIFQNVVDNPTTPKDETDNSFTQLVTAINSGSSIKTTIKNAVKIKLGL